MFLGYKGTPEQWISEASQVQKNVKVFCVLHGSGKKFGLYFHEKTWTSRTTGSSFRESLPSNEENSGSSACLLGSRTVPSHTRPTWEERMLAIRTMIGDSFSHVFPRHETMWQLPVRLHHQVQGLPCGDSQEGSLWDQEQGSQTGQGWRKCLSGKAH